LCGVHTESMHLHFQAKVCLELHAMCSPSSWVTRTLMYQSGMSTFSSSWFAWLSTLLCFVSYHHGQVFPGTTCLHTICGCCAPIIHELMNSVGCLGLVHTRSFWTAPIICELMNSVGCFVADHFHTSFHTSCCCKCANH